MEAFPDPNIALKMDGCILLSFCEGLFSGAYVGFREGNMKTDFRDEH